VIYLFSRIHRHSLVQQQKNYRGVLTRQRLLYDLVQENPQAAAFVAELERQVQEIKEEFTKSIYSITGTMHGNEGELMFPAFQSRKRKNVDKRFKGLSG